MTIISAVGLKRGFALVRKFPALILTPMFCFWTVGPSGTSTACCGRFNCHNNELKVSFRETWVNALISTIGCVSYVAIFLDTEELLNVSQIKRGYGPPGPFLEIIIPFLVLYFLGAVFPVLLLQFLDKCKKCCCTCCMPCFPVLNVTTLDLDEEFAKPTTQVQPGFELYDLFTLPQVTGVLKSH